MTSRKGGAQPFYSAVKCIPDSVLMQQYLDALRPVSPFFSKVTLGKRKNENGQLRIFLPRPPKGWQIKVNDNEWTAGQEAFLGGSGEFLIACDTQGQGSAQCELYLSFVEENIFAGGDSFFSGGPGRGFDPFGASSDEGFNSHDSKSSHIDFDVF